MGEVSIGDRVIGSSGTSIPVLGVYPQGIQDTYKVSFSDGSSTECSMDHLWAIRGRGSKQKEYGVWTLDKIQEKGLKDASGAWDRYIPLVKPVQFPEKDFLIDPYLLGLLLGDAQFEQSGSVRFTNIDDELIDYVRNICGKYNLVLRQVDSNSYRLSAGTTYGHGFQGHHNYISASLRYLELHYHRSWEKFIPTDYMTGSVEQRLSLLQGLMDTDGWIGEKKNVHFASSSKQLALDVQYLVRSLGGWSNYNGAYKTPGRDSHQISISMPMNLVPFRLTRKAKRCENRSWARPRSIRKIEYVGKKEMQCIMVAAEDGLYVTDDFIVTHNTTAMRLAIYLIKDIDQNLILATDGSAEGLLTGLSHRPKRVSIYWRDEVSGFFDAINRKDYLAGLPEILTHLYDVPPIYNRLLRKETITISEPYFIFYGGGIRDKVYSLIDDNYITSGFLPRFLIVSAENDLSRLRRTGPPTEVSTEGKDNVVKSLMDLSERYNQSVKTTILGQEVLMPTRIEARLSDEAWALYGEYEETLTNVAVNSDIAMLALPTFGRLGFSLLKLSLLIAASRRLPDSSNHLQVEISDVKQAAFYIQKWGHYSIDLLLNAGRSTAEKAIERALGLIRRKEGITKAEFMQRLHLSARESKDLVETMVQRGLIDIKPAGRGHRIYSL